MTIFPRELIRLPELFSVNFARWGARNPGGDLHDLSDRALEDIGLAEPLRRDFDAVKPFWMP
ncbi:MAG: hypothetical protein WA280_21460 [Xanthobacteraceae bacterium]